MSALSSAKSGVLAHGASSCRCAKCMSATPFAPARPVIRAAAPVSASAHTSAAGCKCHICTTSAVSSVRRNRRGATIMAAAAGEVAVKQDKLAKLLVNNKKWAESQVRYDPDFFNRLSEQQTPEYLWIGCADSRVPAETVVGLNPGELFVQRNVGNQANHRDMNVQSCLEFSVKALKVKTIIVCGHYKCGAVKAALTLPSKTPGLVNCWISDIREARNQHLDDLKGLSEEEQVERLCEFNVLRQVFHVCTSPTVQDAWDNGVDLQVFGVCYSLNDGLMQQLAGPISSNEQLGTSDQEVFVSNQVEKKRLGAFGTLKALFLGNKNPEPVEPVKETVKANTQKLVSKLSAHVAWDKGTV